MIIFLFNEFSSWLEFNFKGECGFQISNLYKDNKYF